MVQVNQTFNAMDNSSIELPDASAFADMDMSRDGQNLILQSSNGQDIVIENYFTAVPQPTLEASDGSVLTPELVEAFVQSPEQLSQIETAAGAEPVGAIEELHGEATVTRANGSSESITLGTPIYQGDVVETSADGGVNILFVDETSMALSEGARFAVTDYSFDAQTESGTTNFSVLRGVFVFTSGLIGRDDPDDVTIDTPVGSIGIRGTIIAGHINPEGESSISVVEGAIVVKNGSGERTLSQQFETIQVDGFNSEMQDMGVLEPAQVTQAYGSASYVIPSLFSNINDAAKEQAAEEEQQQTEESLDAGEEIKEEVIEEPTEETIDQKEIILEKSLEPQKMDLSKQEAQDQKEQKSSQDQKEQQTKTSDLSKTELQNPNSFELQSTRKLSFEIKHELSEFDLIQGGGIAAKLLGAPANVQFTFDNGTTISKDGNFQIVGNEIQYTGSPSSSIDQNIDLGSHTIIALDPKGQRFVQEFNPIVQDIALNLSGAGLAAAHNDGLINAGDLNSDGNDDFAFINASNEIEIVNEPGGANIETLNGSGGTTDYSSVASLGDLNNDGYDDLIAGSISSGSGGGSAIIDGAISLLNENSIDFNAAVSSITGDNYGHAVAGIGDFNGDGKLDYAVGAPGYETDAGAVYIHADGIGGDGFLKVFSSTSGENLGEYVGGLGDVNGDGLSDALIGGSDTAYVLFGGQTSDIDVSTLNAASSLTIVSGPSHTIINGSSAGDFNADGYDDFVISMQETGSSNVLNYVVFGNLDGTVTMSDGVIDIDELENPNIAFKINDVAGMDSDYTARSIGDLNGDGFDDIEIGSETTGFHVVHGSMAGNAAYVTDGSVNDISTENNHVQASLDGQSLVDSLNFVDGNKLDISMSGNAQDNNFRVNNSDFNNINGGNGYDTINFGAVGATAQTLDFSSITYEQISGVERLQFAQDGDGNSGDTIRLTVDNIFNLLKTSDTGELKIELHGAGTTGNLEIDAAGSYDDSVAGTKNALDEATNATITHTTNGSYEQYDIGGYTLYIDQGINTTTV